MCPKTRKVDAFMIPDARGICYIKPGAEAMPKHDHLISSIIMYEWVCVSEILGPVLDPTILKTYFAFRPLNPPFPL